MLILSNSLYFFATKIKLLEKFTVHKLTECCYNHSEYIQRLTHKYNQADRQTDTCLMASLPG